MQNLKYKILDSVTKIGKADWDSVFGEIPEGYEFYKTLEESKLEEFNFYYITVYRQEVPVLIAPVFTTEFDLAIAIEGGVEKIIYFIRKILPRFLVFNSIFCGSPFGEHGILGIKEGEQDKDLIFEKFLELLNGLSEQSNFRLVIFKDFSKSDTGLLDRLLGKSFFKVSSFPSCIMELNFNSFEEYLKSLGPSTRKSLRRKLKDAHSKVDIEVKIEERAGGLINDIFKLYENTYHAGATKFERLTKEFFINVSKNISGSAKYFLYYCDGRLSAFNLCFVYKDLFIDKFIGFDYDISYKYNLYFISWCYNIKWCLKNSIRYYQTGQTDYHAKKRLGGRLMPLYAYLKHQNCAVNFILKCLAALLKPENFDPDLKKQNPCLKKG